MTTDFLDRVEPTGIRCDECADLFVGPTETSADVRALVMRAEEIGWSCTLVAGRSRHLCPMHARSA